MKKWLGLGILFAALIVSASSPAQPPAGDSAADPTAPRTDISFGKIPLQFIPNAGQIDGPAAFYVQGGDKTIYFSPGGLTFVLNSSIRGRETGSAHPAAPPSEEWVVKLDFVGADPAALPESLEESGALISHFKGRPENWKTGLPASSRIIYRELWPGIDLVYYGTVDRMKYEFIIHPGADPSQIKLAYRGAERVSLTEEGRLAVDTPAGGFEDDIPAAWQDIDGERAHVAVAYDLEADADTDSSASSLYGFEVGAYDTSRTLVLDPVILVYCGFISGSASDQPAAIAVDGSRNAYVVGNTRSTEVSFPVKVGPSLIHGGGTFQDAFVAKVNAAGTDLVYCGYIGGSSSDNAKGVAVDGSGQAFIAGYTYSTQTTFPITVGPGHSGGIDAFVAKVSADGTSLLYCRYIGGSSYDEAHGIAVDASGNAYVAGLTASSEQSFPVVGPLDPTYNGGDDAFVAKVGPDGSALVYCGYIGGTGKDWAMGIAVDGSGSAYVTGITESPQTSFPVLGDLDATHNGAADAFIAKVNAAGSAIVYCGYIGGGGDDTGRAVAVDGAGQAYIAGATYSHHHGGFPAMVGPDVTYGGDGDAFVAKVNAAGSAFVYCGYIGGADEDEGYGIAVDAAGQAYVAGYAYSSEATFPVVGGPALTHSGWEDAFVAKINASGTQLLYCGYIGGSSRDMGFAVAVDGSGNAYVTGQTVTGDGTFPVVVGPKLTYGGVMDAFVAKIGDGYIISGAVTSGGSGLVDVVMAGFPGDPKTDASGYYAGTVPEGWSGAITPALAGYAFDPANRVYSSVAANQARHDYTATMTGPPPAIGLNRTRLNYGVEIGGPSTRTQQAAISNTGGGTLTWTAISGAAWLTVTPGTGTNTGAIQVSVNAAGLAAGAYSSQVTVTAPGASNSPRTIPVHLNVYTTGAPMAPFGVFDTPANGSTVYGAIPVTGWALDDIQVQKVEIKRSPHTTDPPAVIGSDGLVFISDAIFVEGARPDVEAAFPQHPLSYVAGWGYMMLTNMLPNQGNDAFTIHAFAYDKEGTRVKLGQKTITGNNAGSVKPFGTIDTPAQGEQISGAGYFNFGWALTPQPHMIPTDGSTIRVWVDGVNLGNPSYNHYRPAIATMFPGLANSNGSVGLYMLDTTALANGVHTIAWSAVDSGGNAEGLGSRFFSVLNTGGAEISSAFGLAGDVMRMESGESPAEDASRPRRDFRAETGRHEMPGDIMKTAPRFDAVGVRRGYAPDGASEHAIPDERGVVKLAIPEVERIEIALGGAAAFETGRGQPGKAESRAAARGTGEKPAYQGFEVVGRELRPLPIGSILDPVSGVFTWQPGAGFLGEYTLVFIREIDGLRRDGVWVKITIAPKF